MLEPGLAAAGSHLPQLFMQDREVGSVLLSMGSHDCVLHALCRAGVRNGSVRRLWGYAYRVGGAITCSITIRVGQHALKMMSTCEKCRPRTAVTRSTCREKEPVPFAEARQPPADAVMTLLDSGLLAEGAHGTS